MSELGSDRPYGRSCGVSVVMSDAGTARLFVAVPLPMLVREQVRQAVATLRESTGVERLRWVRPEAWHLTLAFLGDVESRRADDLATRLGRAAGRAQPLTLRIAGAGRFRGNVLWAGVTGDLVALRHLAAAVGAAARRAGSAVEQRPYRAHLTLARSDGSTPLGTVAEALGGLATDSWTAEELHLVRSQLGAGPGGSARHEVVARWALGRARSSGGP